MPKISVQHESAKNPQEALKIIQNFFETDLDLRKMDPKIQCQFQTESLKGKVKGSQFEADVEVQRNSGQGSKVSIAIQLPLLLTPLKGKVEEILKRKLHKHLS